MKPFPKSGKPKKLKKSHAIERMGATARQDRFRRKLRPVVIAGGKDERPD
jgi:hypothetical protein